MKKIVVFKFLLLFLVSFSYAQQKPAVTDILTRLRYNLAEGEYKTALKNYELLISIDSLRASEYLYNKGMCHYYLKEAAASENCFRMGLRRTPNYEGNNLGLGIQLFNQTLDSSIYFSKKVLEALKDSIYPLERTIKDNSVLRRGLLSSAYQNIGMAFFNKGNTDSALYYIDLAITTNPASDDHLLACSYIYFKSNNFEKAYAYARKAIELNRYESRSALLIILSLEKLGKISKANSPLKDCISLQNNALSFWKRGDGKLKADLMDSGRMKGYKNMEEINAEFYVLEAYLFFKNNQKEAAAEAYNKAVKLNHDSYYRLATEEAFMEYMDDYIVYKLKTPLSPKSYLPLYNNIFSNTIINSK